MVLHKFQYDAEAERSAIMEENKHLSLIEEQNIIEGNFLIFSETPNYSVSQEIEELKQGSKLLTAQNNALSERADFIEDVVAEMATQVYQ